MASLDIESWTPNDVAQWIKGIGMIARGEIFI
jgi:hypothetical protein